MKITSIPARGGLKQEFGKETVKFLFILNTSKMAFPLVKRRKDES